MQTHKVGLISYLDPLVIFIGLAFLAFRAINDQKSLEEYGNKIHAVQFEQVSHKTSP